MWQPVLMINGYLVSILGLAMLVPAGWDILYEKMSWSPFLSSALGTLFLGMAMFLANRTTISKITLQQGYLLTSMSWISLILLGAVPFLVSGVTGNFSNALFESTSGLSTTGATVFADVEALPKSVLLWRSMLNCMGGIGIVIFAAAMLPFLGIGGMQMFQRENSDMNEKFMPKFSYIAKRILIVYLFLTALCVFCLYAAGMGWFDAVNHAMAAVATGGLSTKNASVGFFDSVRIETVLIIFMILGSLPMTFYVIVLQGRDWNSFGTSQIAAFLKILLLYTLFTSAYLTFIGKYDFWQAVRYSGFNIVSIVTTTGFVSTDYMLWGPWIGAFFVIFALTGGCTGSTSGSIKIFRWQVLFAYIRRSLIVATEPNRVMPVKVGSGTVDNGIVSSVFLFFTVFMLSIAVLTCLVAAAGYNFEIAFSSVIACITNSGPGLGSVVGPAGNFSSLSDFAKCVLSFAMLLGRLEVLTIMVVFSRSFWSQN